jgi:hypothetical protein
MGMVTNIPCPERLEENADENRNGVRTRQAPIKMNPHIEINKAHLRVSFKCSKLKLLNSIDLSVFKVSMIVRFKLICLS